MKTVLTLGFVVMTSGFAAMPAAADKRAAHEIGSMGLCHGGQIVGDCFFGRHRDDDFWDRWNTITCDDARRNLANRGYTKIKTLRCKGMTYVFKARWKGNNYELKVNSRNGALRSARKI